MDFEQSKVWLVIVQNQTFFVLPNAKESKFQYNLPVTIFLDWHDMKCSSTENNSYDKTAAKDA